jgi:hypothetical protein
MIRSQPWSTRRPPVRNTSAPSVECVVYLQPFERRRASSRVRRDDMDVDVGGGHLRLDEASKRFVLYDELFKSAASNVGGRV